MQTHPCNAAGQSLRWALVSLLSIGTVACGKMQDVAEGAGHAATDAKDAGQRGAQSLAEQADDWVNADPLRDRQEFCAAEQGTWVQSMQISPCEDGVVTLRFDGEVQQQACTAGTGGEETGQCLHRDEQGLVYFNDGPSVPNLLQSATGAVADRADMQAYNRIFWPAGIAHDYCYHHGAANSGLKQKDCDQRYFSDLYAVCAHADHQGLDWFRPSTCTKMALSHYSAVRSQGNKSFAVLSAKVDVPAYQPLWQQYGFAEDALDEETLSATDERLSQMKIGGE